MIAKIILLNFILISIKDDGGIIHNGACNDATTSIYVSNITVENPMQINGKNINITMTF